MSKFNSKKNHLAQSKEKSFYPAFKIALVYFIISFLWIFFSDRLLELITEDLSNYSNYQTIKGIGFITLSTLLIFFLIFREIREKNSIIEAINESEQWYNILFSNIPNVDFFLFDKEMNYILAQGEGLNKMGIKPGEIQGKNLRELIFDREFLKFLKENYNKILKGNTIKEEIQYGESWYELRGAPLYDEHNQVFAGVSLFINFTEYKAKINEIDKRKKEYKQLFDEYQEINKQLKNSNIELSEANRRIRESEKKYKAFISQTNEGIYRFELEKPVPVKLPVEKQEELIQKYAYLAECNDSFSGIYGYTKEDFRQIKLSEFQKTVKSKNSKKIVRSFIESGYRLNNIVNEEYTKDGKKIFLSKNITGILVNDELISVWGSQTNITEQKKYERELLTAKKKAEESDKLKSAFLANMSHEIRTPLNGILGFSYLLSRGNIDPDQKEKYSRIIKNNGRQLLNLINDILDLSKLEAQQLKIYETEFSLNSMISEIETLYLNNEGVRNKNLKITTSTQLSKNKDYIKADKERLMQILQNLLNNAVKFTDKGKIEFGYKVIDSELKFYVQDTGIGIPRDKQTRIFTRFQQEENNFKKQPGGTGLGLSISKGLLNLMDGRIWVNSEEGTGTTFYFTIPFRPAVTIDDEEEKSEIISLEGKKILIVEDDQNSSDLLSFILQDFNCKIIYNENGKEAIETVKKESDLDLVLMDIRLPKMDGLEAAKEIRKINKTLPVIAQSAYAMQEDKKKCIEAGCNDFIAKPLDKENFLKLIVKYV